MASATRGRLTGGCQCGAVRYRLASPPTHASICWCRMCQKAVGGYFGAFARVRREDLTWTRGEPGVFRSSEAAERGFCRDCGTPLSYRFRDGGNISVTIGSLDDPAAVSPDTQYSAECRPALAEQLAALPANATGSWLKPELAPRFASRQHPDHDTDRWPPLVTA